MEKTFEALKKYNFWDKNIKNQGILRDFYLNKLAKSIGSKLVKVITGQRRAGKSYIIRQFISYLIENLNITHKNIFYFPREAIEFSEINNYKQVYEIFNFYKNKLNVKGKIFIFIDEIQLISDWEKLINAWSQDFTDEYEVFITGSNSKLLSAELSSLLSGRFISFEVFPFSFGEFLNTQSDKNFSRENLINYFSDTGLPEAILLQNNEMKTGYFQSLFDTIVLRDIVLRFGVKDVHLLKELFYFVLRNIGNLTSFSSIVKYYKSRGLKTNYETLSKYFDFLTSTFTIHQALRYDLKAKSVLGAERKFYLNDLGFINWQLGFSPEQINYYLENYIYLQLRRIGFTPFVGVKDKREIDFVAQKGRKQLFVQVAYSLTEPSTWERELKIFKSMRTSIPRIIVHNDDFDFSDDSGILFIKAWEFEEKLSYIDKL